MIVFYVTLLLSVIVVVLLKLFHVSTTWNNEKLQNANKLKVFFLWKCKKRKLNKIIVKNRIICETKVKKKGGMCNYMVVA